MNHGPPVISIDVEDWPQSSWDRGLPIRPRAADNTRHLLEILARAKVRTTMFVLGKFAETFPDVVREIQAAGHEIGSHGYGHVEIFKQTPAEFRDDVNRSKDFLEQLVGAPVKGYRAPDFSIVERSLWALEVLADLGFEYDSSIYPVKVSRYGIPSWPLDPRRVVLPDGREIVELPLAAWAFAGRNWRVAGGGTHRLLPGPISRFLAGRVLQRGPFVYYCHPYEFDSHDFQSMEVPVPWFKRLHQGMGRKPFERRFVAFLNKLGGRSFRDLVAERTWPEYRLSASRILADQSTVASQN